MSLDGEVQRAQESEAKDFIGELNNGISSIVRQGLASKIDDSELRKNASDYISSEIAKKATFYSGNEQQFRELQRHVESGLETYIALEEQKRNGPASLHAPLNRRSWKYALVGAIPGMVIGLISAKAFSEYVLYPSFSGESFIVGSVILAGLAAGAVIGIGISTIAGGKSDATYNARVQDLETKALQAFVTTS